MKPLTIYSCLIVEEETNLWHRQLTSTLRDMGHQVITPSCLGLRKSWFIMQQGLWNKRCQINLTERILIDVKRNHANRGINLFFCYLFPFQFTPELFTEIIALGIPCVYFFCDNFAYPEVATKYSPFATLNWVPEVEALEQFQKVGSQFVHLPMAANPAYSHPVSIQEDIDLAFLGTKNPYRRKLLGQVLETGLDLKIYGDGWHPSSRTYHQLEVENSLLPNLPEPTLSEKLGRFWRWKKSSFLQLTKYGFAPRHRSKEYLSLGAEYDLSLATVANCHALTATEANQVFSFSRVTIGINDQFNPLTKEGVVIYTKLRDFEATMAGACYLTQATPDQTHLFEVDREIMTYSSVEELIDKAGFLLRNEQARQKLRISAQERSLREHTWEHRFKQLFIKLGIV